MTASTHINAAIDNAISRIRGIDFNTMAAEQVEASDLTETEIEFGLRIRQRQNAAKNAKIEAAENGVTVDFLRTIARRIFSASVEGRALSPLARTLVMGHSLNATWRIHFEASELEWDAIVAAA